MICVRERGDPTCRRGSGLSTLETMTNKRPVSGCGCVPGSEILKRVSEAEAVNCAATQSINDAKMLYERWERNMNVSGAVQSKRCDCVFPRRLLLTALIPLIL